MRKVFLLGVVLAMSLVFAFTSFAQEDEGEVTCSKCAKGCGLEALPCISGGQDEVECESLDISDNCFIFPVCDCPDTEQYFLAGKYVGIRMHILTKGVYWAENLETISFRAFESISDACRDLDDLEEGEDYFSGDFTNVLYMPDSNCVQGDADTPVDSEQCIWTWDPDEDASAENPPKLKSLAQDRDFALFQIPEDWEGFSFWNLDIPAIRIDVKEVLEAGLAGENVQIKIEFVRAGAGGICQGACQVICECTIDVATLCTKTGVDYVGGGCIYFPYVITQYPPWATGIAIANLGTLGAADMVAKFTLTDNTGKSFIYTKDDFQVTQWSAVLDNLVLNGKFDGTPAAGAAWLKVDTNFKVDGYQFVTDGVFGGSTLGRMCDSLDGGLRVDVE